MAKRGLGDTGHALQSAQQAVSLAARLHNTMWEGYWLLELGTAQRLTGRLNEALDSFHSSALLHHQIGDKGREAQAWDGAGQVNRELGEIATAVELHDRAAEAFRRLGVDWLLATALHNLAIAQRADRRVDQSKDTAAEALRLLTPFSDPAAESMKDALRQFS
jgi:tetratricopeptide (TPR) repeat protein